MPPETKPHPDADRIAEEVAARYGVAVRKGAVAQVPRGVSGRPLPVWDGHRLVYPDWDRKAIEKAKRAEQARRMRLARVDDVVLARRARVAELHAAGASVGEIAEALQAKEAAIRNDHACLGLIVNRAKPRDPAEAIRSLIGRGFTRREDIAAELGWGVNRLVREAAKAKIVLPDAPPARAARRSAKGGPRNGQAALPVSAAPRPPRDTKKAVEAMQAKRRRLCNERRVIVARLHAEGKTLAQMRDATGAHQTTLRRDLSDLGLPLPTVPRDAAVATLSPRALQAQVRQAEVAALVAHGLTRTAICKRLRLGADTLRRDLDVLGLTCADPPPAAGEGFKVALLRALQDAEATRDSLCAALGWTRGDLTRRAARHRIKLPPPRPSEIPNAAQMARLATKRARMDQAASLHGQGHGYKAIAGALGVSEGCVHGYLQELGLTVPRTGVAARRARVKALRHEGMTANGIAAETGECVSTVCADLRVLGLGAGWRP